MCIVLYSLTILASIVVAKVVPLGWFSCTTSDHEDTIMRGLETGNEIISCRGIPEGAVLLASFAPVILNATILRRQRIVSFNMWEKEARVRGYVRMFIVWTDIILPTKNAAITTLPDYVCPKCFMSSFVRLHVPREKSPDLTFLSYQVSIHFVLYSKESWQTEPSRPMLHKESEDLM